MEFIGKERGGGESLGTPAPHSWSNLSSQGSNVHWQAFRFRRALAAYGYEIRASRRNVRASFSPRRVISCGALLWNARGYESIVSPPAVAENTRLTKMRNFYFFRFFRRWAGVWIFFFFCGFYSGEKNFSEAQNLRNNLEKFSVYELIYWAEVGILGFCIFDGIWKRDWNLLIYSNFILKMVERFSKNLEWKWVFHAKKWDSFRFWKSEIFFAMFLRMMRKRDFKLQNTFFVEKLIFFLQF